MNREAMQAKLFELMARILEQHKTLKQRRALLELAKNEFSAGPEELNFFEQVFLAGHPRAKRLYQLG